MKIRPVEAELFYAARQRDRETGRQAGRWLDRYGEAISPY